MKFSCDSCSARYEISDEKVAGNVLRVRCRRCGHTMTVSAPQQAPTIDAAPPETAAEQWYYALAGETFGPYGEDELIERFQSGRLGDEAYVWQPSFAEWKPAVEIPVFGSSIAQFRRSMRVSRAPATVQIQASEVERLTAARQHQAAPRRATIAQPVVALTPTATEVDDAVKAPEAKAPEVESAAPASRPLGRPLGEAPAPEPAAAAVRNVRRRTSTAGVSFDELKARLEARAGVESAATKPAPTVKETDAPDEPAAPARMTPDDTAGEFAPARVAPVVARDPEPTGEFDAAPAAAEMQAPAQEPAKPEPTREPEPTPEPEPTREPEIDEAVADEVELEVEVDEELSGDDVEEITPPPTVEPSPPAEPQAVAEEVPATEEVPAAEEVPAVAAEASPPTESAEAPAASPAQTAAAAAKAARAEKKKDAPTRQPTIEDDLAGWFGGSAAEAPAAASDNGPTKPPAPAAPVARVPQASPGQKSPMMAIAIVVVVLVVLGGAVFMATRDRGQSSDNASSTASTTSPAGADPASATAPVPGSADEAGAVAEASADERSDGSGQADVQLISETQMRLLLLRGRRTVVAGIDAGVLATLTSTGLSAEQMAVRRAAEAEQAAQAVERTGRRPSSAGMQQSAETGNGGGANEPAQRTGFFANMNGARTVTTRDRSQPAERSGPPAEHFAAGLSGFVSEGLERCAQRQRIEEGELSVGRVTLRLTVRPTGEVSRVTMDDAVMGTTFSSCVQGVSRRWRFDGFDGDDVTLVRAYIVQ